jgi:hypothetical protein
MINDILLANQDLYISFITIYIQLFVLYKIHNKHHFL